MEGFKMMADKAVGGGAGRGRVEKWLDGVVGEDVEDEEMEM